MEAIDSRGRWTPFSDRFQIDTRGRYVPVAGRLHIDGKGTMSILNWPPISLPITTVDARTLIAPEASILSFEAATGAWAVPINPAFTVSVNGVSVPVLEIQCATRRSFVDGTDPATVRNAFCRFRMGDAGVAKVQVTVTGGPPSAAKICPPRLGVTPTIVGDVVSFTMPSPLTKYELRVNTVDTNDSADSVLYICADPIDPTDPLPGDPGVYVYEPGAHARETESTSRPIRYFGPGVHTLGTNAWRLNTGDLVYLAPGAVVRGRFIAGDKSNVTIKGHGILGPVASDPLPTSGTPVNFYNGDNCSLEGITLWNPPKWTHQPCHMRNYLDYNLCIFGWRNNADGLDIVGCQDFEISRCLIRGYDDGICLKGLGDWNTFQEFPGYYASPRRYSDAQTSVLRGHIHDCMIFSDLGIGALEIGEELACQEVADILWEDCDVVHAHYRSAIGIKPNGTGHDARVHDITYRRIWIEDKQATSGGSGLNFDNTIGLQVGGGSMGSIDGITFEDIYVNGANIAPSRFVGYSSSSLVRNVSFRNLRYNTALVTNLTDAKFVGAAGGEMTNCDAPTFTFTA